MIALGNNIKKYRKDRKISQEQLAEFFFEGNYGLNNWQLKNWHEYIASFETKLKNADVSTRRKVPLRGKCHGESLHCFVNTSNASNA